MIHSLRNSTYKVQFSFLNPQNSLVEYGPFIWSARKREPYSEPYYGEQSNRWFSLGVGKSVSISLVQKHESQSLSKSKKFRNPIAVPILKFSEFSSSPNINLVFFKIPFQS